MKRFQNSRRKIQNALFVLCFFSSAFLSFACSIPNLESAECSAARQNLKEFYSLHFDSEMRFSPESLSKTKKYLTPELIASLPKTPIDADVFTVNSNDYPKAFRIGSCRAESPDKTIFEVLLFWKTDERNEQQSIEVEAARRGDQWQINKIERKK